MPSFGNFIDSTTFTKAIYFTENGAATYTGNIAIPAGSIILDAGVYAVALWTAATSAGLIAGDVNDPNGWFTTTDLKATDLLAGESINIEHPGGVAGAYIGSEQRVLYRATAETFTFVITSVGAGTAGRTLCYVTYVTPNATQVTA